MAFRRSSVIIEQALLSSSPGSPASNHGIIYPKTDGLWYTKDASGTEIVINPKYTSSDAPVTYSDVPVWTGTTSPSGTLTAQYFVQRHGNMCYMSIAGTYPTPGAANTQVKIPIPAAAPQPVTFILGAGVGQHVYAAFGYFDSGTNGGVPASRCSINRQTSGTAWEFFLISNSAAAAWFSVSGWYLTS